MPGPSWTTGEVRKAIQMRQQRYTIAAVARELGRSYGAVSVKLSNAGATQKRPHRRKPGRFEMSVRRLAKPGVSDPMIARRLNTTAQEVWRCRKRLGIPAGISSREAWKYRIPKKVVKIVRCFHCDEKSKHCGRGSSLAAQGWWTGRSAFGYENYCPGCVGRYGSPDTWSVGR